MLVAIGTACTGRAVTTVEADEAIASSYFQKKTNKQTKNREI